MALSLSITPKRGIVTFFQQQASKRESDDVRGINAIIIDDLVVSYEANLVFVARREVIS